MHKQNGGDINQNKGLIVESQSLKGQIVAQTMAINYVAQER